VQAQAAAPPAECPTSGARVVSFAKVTDGGGFVTADGEEVRLAGIIAPGRGGEAVLSGAAAAEQVLRTLLQNKTLAITPAAAGRDRYGRTVAVVFADGAWVEAQLLKRGQVRAAPDLASAACARALLAAEDEGRVARAGHWRSGVFRVRKADEVRGTGTFQIVEGTVTTATVNRGRAYINFGADYRSDFTVTVAPDDMKIFRSAKFDVRSLAGKHVRVRGWMEFYNGPEMTIAMPAAIEVLK